MADNEPAAGQPPDQAQPSPAPQHRNPQQREQRRSPQRNQEHDQQQGRQRDQQQGQQRDQQRGQQRDQQQWVDISVVVPLYNEAESLRELHTQIRSTLGRMGMRYEILFVDDGSTDRSFQVLRDLKRLDRHIRIIRFRRNYGKSAALSVAFEKSQGNVVITMDADLQDDPSEIPGLKRKLDEGFDLVSGWKKSRHDPITKTIPSRFFNFVTARLTGIRIHDFNCGLKAYKRDVVKSVRVYGELHRYIPVLAHWEGFRIGEVVVQHRPRKYGKTKFGFGRFWKGFLDLLTALFTTRYLRRPLHLFGFWGMVAVSAGVIIDGWLTVEWITGRTSLSNRPLFLAGFMLIIVGMQFVSIGLLGEMISKTRGETEEYSIKDFIR